MNVLSLFDGMSCGQIALNRIGISPTKYYASELDKYAIKVTQANHPDTIQLGDVTNWREWDIDWSSVDLLIGGSPCQGFSFAGKQLAFDDPRSKLFFVYVDILNHIKSVNPDVKFMLENVRMKKEYLTVISEQLNVEPICINSALVSAQNRVRYYWCNWEVEQPEDKGTLLKGIIESNVSQKYLLSDKLVKGLQNGSPAFKGRFKPHDPEKTNKSYCLTARYYKMGKTDPYIKCGAIRGRYLVDGKRADAQVDSMAGITEQRLEVRADEKTNCLTTVQKDNVVVEKSIHYRKLTPTECERLQTVPDNYTNHVSNTQRYKMLGNGWTVDVIAHIFKSGLNWSNH